jgi:hypothetical protein
VEKFRDAVSHRITQSCEGLKLVEASQEKAGMDSGDTSGRSVELSRVVGSKEVALGLVLACKEEDLQSPETMKESGVSISRDAWQKFGSIGASDLGGPRGKSCEVSVREVSKGYRPSDQGGSESLDHFASRGFVSLEVEDQTLGVTKFRVVRR